MRQKFMKRIGVFFLVMSPLLGLTNAFGQAVGEDLVKAP